MAGSITDKLSRVTDSTTGRPVVALLASPGKAEGAGSININDATNWTTTTAIYFSIYTTTTIGGVSVKDSTSQTDWKGTLSGTTISNLTITGGTDRAYSAGAIVEITPTSAWAKELYDNIIAHANQDGSLVPSAVRTALGLSNSSNDGWIALGSTITYQSNNGNREYVINTSANETANLSPGMRFKLTRGTTPPTQCTDLESSTSQYASKTSPTGISFTDDFSAGAWVKLESYTGSSQTILSRYNATSGWTFDISSTGTVRLLGYNASSANVSYVESYQAIPLNKWVHVAAQLDMSAFTATSTTSYVMVNGANVAAKVTRTGTNPTALVQAGNLELGGRNGGANPFDGKIADCRLWSAKRTVTEVQDDMNKQIVGNESNLVAYFKLDGNFTDSTSNANSLTGQNSAVATNADNPMNTTEYAIVTKVTASQVTLFTGNTYNVPNGTLSTPYYSREKSPLNFPPGRDKWYIEILGFDASSLLGAGAWANSGSFQISVPIGSWRLTGVSVLQATRTPTGITAHAALSEATTSLTGGYEDSVGMGGWSSSTATGTFGTLDSISCETFKTFTAQTVVYLVTYSQNAGNLTIGLLTPGAPQQIKAECAYL